MSDRETKIALVTGASSGIGKVTAQYLVNAGFHVFGTSRRPPERGPTGVNMLVCDVTDEQSVHAVVEQVLSRAGRIDVLVNNAGIGLLGAAEESSIEQVRSLFEVNYFGLVGMTNAVLPSMRQRRSGRIINISSILGLIPAPYSAHYSATKHAVEGYSDSLDHEVRSFGIRVSLVEPGITRSSFEQSALKSDGSIADYAEGRAILENAMKDGMVAGDPPEIVARTVVRAATEPKPKRRYASGKVAERASLARRLVPAEWFDQSLRKQFGLPAK